MTEATWQEQNIEVVVTGSGGALDHAVAALVEKCGYPVRIAPERTLAALCPVVVIFRDELQLTRLRHLVPDRDVTWIGMDSRPSSGTKAGAHGVHWLGIDDPALELAALLRQSLGAPSGRARVTMTPREREVVGMYVSGATAAETAAEFFVAECTVKTHYSRVALRYERAGRPIRNSTQLLLEMMADGWIAPPHRD